MKKSFFFFLKYYLFWILYFLFFRGFFLLYNYILTEKLTALEIFQTFTNGLIMDISVGGYFSVLVGLLLAITAFIPIISQKIIKIYTLILLIFNTILGITDTALYGAWGTRVNAQLIPYLKDPLSVLNVAPWWQWILSVVIVTVIVFLFFQIYKHAVDTLYFRLFSMKWRHSIVYLLLTAALIIPIRGGVSTAPLNFSKIYFSEKIYANHSAYNYFWGFVHALTHNDHNENPVHYFSENRVAEILQGTDSLATLQAPVYIKHTNKPTNVILVILESFSNKIIEPLGGLKSLTPNLNKLCTEGIAFSNFYSTGNRSDKGISSLIAGYPAIIKAGSVFEFAEKMENLAYLPAVFKNQGYKTSFYYGGDINFYNTKMMLVQCGTDKIVSQEDFSLSQRKQKWGASDEYLFEKTFHDLETEKQPFFSTIYTISSHEPYDIPNYNKLEDKYCNSVAYTDSCLGVFIDKLKHSKLWRNTLLIITADHTSLEPKPLSAIDEPASYKIPMIWAGGVIDSAFVCDRICMQTDLKTTLTQQFSWKTNPDFFSKNLFTAKEYAFFFRNEGWGYFSPEVGFFQNIESNKTKFFYGEKSQKLKSQTDFAKAFTQYLHYDFLKK